MAYKPVSGLPVQYSTIDNVLASGYYLKFYEADSSTALSMATDASGATPLAYCELSTSGLPISDPLNNESDFIPHLNQPYKSVLYPTETDAINDTNGVRTISNTYLGPSISTLDDIDLDNDFSAGSIRISKAGDRVTITSIGFLSHSSANSAESSTGLVPSGYRPSDRHDALVSSNGGLFGDKLQTAFIDTDGTFGVSYKDFTGSASAATTTASFSVTYNI